MVAAISRALNSSSGSRCHLSEPITTSFIGRHLPHQVAGESLDPLQVRHNLTLILDALCGYKKNNIKPQLIVTRVELAWQMKGAHTLTLSVSFSSSWPFWCVYFMVYRHWDGFCWYILSAAISKSSQSFRNTMTIVYCISECLWPHNTAVYDLQSSEHEHVFNL